MSEILVLGAGIVGVSIAIHLRRRGHDVVLIDRRPPGRETSYGNAGIIQKEGVRPRAFPRDLPTLLRVAANGGLDSRYDLSALPGLAGPLAQYWWHSAPERYRRIVAEYAPLIAHSVSEHADLISASGAEGLIEKRGWMLMFRTPEKRDAAFAEARRDKELYGVGSAELDAAAFAQAEPGFDIRASGALHWTDPWTVRDPGGLATAYAAHLESLGGRFMTGDARTLRQTATGWSVTTASGQVSGEQAVIALGPWAGPLTAELGYRLPLFIKRGYHREYGSNGNAVLNHPVLDAETGYLLAPMARGIRLTTGAEFARHDAPPNLTQIDGTEAAARRIFPLGERLDAEPWMGARPCTPDMKPIIGTAPRHAGLWFAFGHAHHGLTLGAVTGRLIGELVDGETPFVEVAPFAATRFDGAR